MISTTQATNIPTQTAHIRYAQCWEDADILLQALHIQAGDSCVSIASAGDNTLAMLSKGPARLIALDYNPAQIACLELRVAAYRVLSHPELLELLGSRPSRQRIRLYYRCRSVLQEQIRQFWDMRLQAITAGIGTAGKFERYLTLFRTKVLPMIHSQRIVHALLEKRSVAAREQFYEKVWNTARWRLLYKLFFSRFMLGHLGRDASLFAHVQGSVANRLLQRTHYGLTQLDPSSNPYLEWILTGQHQRTLPYALRPENFEAIRTHLDRLEIRCCSLETLIHCLPEHSINCFNLSDVFEYLSTDAYHRVLQGLIAIARPGARLAYWNMLVPRSRPLSLAGQLHACEALAEELAAQDKAFFYSRFIVEELGV